MPLTTSFFRVSAFVLLFAYSGCTTEKDVALYDEPYRPQFHFSPAENWMNDPNGLVYYDGEYHLFYQHNPFGNQWGHMSWGHAVSEDLVHWEHLPVALHEEDGVMIFSGSAVVDHNNTSGFGANSRPPLVAVYTGHTQENQSQHLAFSTDRGRTWTKYAENPVLDLGLKDFRDPKVFWHDDTNRWIMVVALPTEYKVHVYGSPDLKTWTLLSEFGPAGSTGGIWECPDLFELPVENEDGASRWVLVVNIGSGAAAGGSGGQYFTGTFDGERFMNDNPEDTVLWIDHGADHYAAVSWSDIPKEDGRRILIGWMNNWQYANDIPTSPWRSAQALPRALTLRKTAAGLRLVQRPVAEFASLREDALRWQAETISGERALEGADFELFEMRLRMELGEAHRAGLTIHHGADEETRIGVNTEEQTVFIDRTKSGVSDFHEAFAAVHTAPISIEDGQVTLHIFADRSSVEVFAQDGLAALTDRIFPPPNTPSLALWAEGGDMRVHSMEVWPLRSAW